jgi:hypothetical protein
MHRQAAAACQQLQLLQTMLPLLSSSAEHVDKDKTQAPMAGAPALLNAHVITLLHNTSSAKLQAGAELTRL